MYSVKNPEAKIRRMVRRIVSRFRPRMIILFGSRARGNAAPDSDADLLVVMDVRGSRRNKAAQIDVAVSDIGLPKDIIVVTPQEYARYRDVAGTFIYPASREGKVLYESTS